MIIRRPSFENVSVFIDELNIKGAIKSLPGALKTRTAPASVPIAINNSAGWCAVTLTICSADGAGPRVDRGLVRNRDVFHARENPFLSVVTTVLLVLENCTPTTGDLCCNEVVKGASVSSSQILADASRLPVADIERSGEIDKVVIASVWAAILCWSLRVPSAYVCK